MTARLHLVILPRVYDNYDNYAGWEALAKLHCAGGAFGVRSCSKAIASRSSSNTFSIWRAASPLLQKTFAFHVVQRRPAESAIG